MAAISSKIAKANPGIKPEVLFAATGEQIGMMKGLDNESRIYMQAATAQARVQAGMQESLQKAQTALEAATTKAEAAQKIADIAAAAKEAVAHENAQSREKVAGTTAKARVQSAGIAGNSRTAAAGIGADARVKAAGMGADSRRDVAATNAGARGASDQAGYDKATDTARINMGKPAQGRSAKQSRAAPPASSPYKGATDVAAAYKAGKLTHDQASQILRANGWAQ